MQSAFVQGALCFLPSSHDPACFLRDWNCCCDDFCEAHVSNQDPSHICKTCFPKLRFTKGTVIFSFRQKPIMADVSWSGCLMQFILRVYLLVMCKLMKGLCSLQQLWHSVWLFWFDVSTNFDTQSDLINWCFESSGSIDETFLEGVQLDFESWAWISYGLRLLEPNAIYQTKLLKDWIYNIKKRKDLIELWYVPNQGNISRDLSDRLKQLAGIWSQAALIRNTLIKVDRK